MSKPDLLTTLLPAPEFSDIDRHFANFIGRFGGDPVLVPLAAAALSSSIRDGHICLALSRLPGVFASLPETNGNAAFRLPTAFGWRQQLRDSDAVGGADEQTPLVLDESDRLYLRRYWNYQVRLAGVIREKCSRNPAADVPSPQTQEDAIAAVLRNELTIICGGPGTGKTATVVRVLHKLLEQEGADRLRIVLTAPTGKAAARLEEALRPAPGQAARPGMPQSASTIHRLLGRNGRSVYFRANADQPLPLDFLIVDEASMVALPLMVKMFAALPARCRVLLLGDRDQLASVEPGNVLADIVDAAASPRSPMASSVITLQKNYRFASDSGIQQACQAVRRGDADGLIAILRAGQQADLISTELATAPLLKDHIGLRAKTHFAELVRERDPAAALAKLAQFRILTPLRQGTWGVEGLNRAVESALAGERIITHKNRAAPYAGRPVLISRNDYELQLYNGDLAILLPGPVTSSASAPADAANPLYAWFLNAKGEVRNLAFTRLPECETAYAMTVHKSQGSEFERVLFILPGSDSPVLTRELIYTALTRARQSVEFCWNEDVLRAALARRSERESGLRELLLLAAPPVKSAAK